MDYSSVHSELIASLNYLRPPVKRPGHNHREHSHGNSRNKDHFTPHPRKTKYSQLRNRGDEHASSTSLILKKTTRTETVEYCTYFKPTRQAIQEEYSPHKSRALKERPIIKVTVIPRSAPTQIPQSRRRRKRNNKVIRCTTSNQEHFIRHNNAHPSLISRSRQKHFRAKTAGSNTKLNKEYLPRYNNDVNFDHTINLKEDIHFLNMDKKRKKDKKNKRIPTKKTSENNVRKGNNIENFVRECLCPSGRNEDNTLNIKSKMSRVRITGRLGLTDDNRYVMDCAATVDDKPVTMVAKASSPVTPPAPPPTTPTTPTSQNADYLMSPTFTVRTPKADIVVQSRRDFNIQTNMRAGPIDSSPFSRPSKESQGTQVNFNVAITSNDNGFSSPAKDKMIQCCCPPNQEYADTDINHDDNNRNESNVKQPHSPLLIISIYSNNSNGGIKIARNSTRVISPVRTIANVVTQNNKPSSRTTRDNMSSDSKSPKRLPSPARKKSQNVTENKNIGTKTVKDKRPADVNSDQKMKQRSISKQVSRSKNSKKEITEKPQPRSTLVSTGVNTEHVLAKKALIDTYTQNIVKRLDKNSGKSANSIPKEIDSKVTVNIEGENEHYDVLFLQGQLATELQVTRTKKKKGTSKAHGKATREVSASMENLLMVEAGNQSGSPSFQDEEQGVTYETIYIDSPLPVLHVRDSLEVSHRREEKSSHNINININNRQNAGQQANKEKLLRSGHFKGDDCSITNPVARDKEIRELLGVGTSKIDKFAQKIVSANVPAFASSFLCGFECTKHIDPFGTRDIGGCQLEECTSDSQKINTKVTLIPCNIKGNFAAHADYLQDPGYKQGYDTKHKIETLYLNYPFYKDTVKNTNKFIGLNEIYDTCKTYTKNNYPTRFHPILIQQQNTATYHHMNRKIQVLLLEHLSRRKQIVLSRNQYDRLKRIIENTLSRRMSQRKPCICKCILSFGDIRKKIKSKSILQPIRLSKLMQTSKVSLEDVLLPKTSVITDVSERAEELKIKSNEPSNTAANKITTVLFTREATNKQTLSTIATNQEDLVPIEGESFTHIKHVTFSSTSVAIGTTTGSFMRGDTHSVHTIFRGTKKSVTPNLGTSTVSLLSEKTYSRRKVDYEFHDIRKPRKPFLQRLMSCLVLRAKKESEVKVQEQLDVPKTESFKLSSIDSYHISTSLGGVDMSSSIFDTSVSFYSNHSIVSPHNKIKRGFFNSVRGLMSNRKS